MTSLLVLNHGLHIVDSIALRDVKSDGLARKSVDENLHSTTEAKYQVKSGLLLNVVVTQGSAVCHLRAGENQTLLVLGNTLLVLVSSLHVVVLISFAITTGGSIHVGSGSLGIAIGVSNGCRAERMVIHVSTMTVLQANKHGQAQESKKHDSHLDSSHGAVAGGAIGVWGRITLFYLKLHRCHQCNGSRVVGAVQLTRITFILLSGTHLRYNRYCKKKRQNK